MTTSEQAKVREYFEKSAAEFDSIYSGRKSAFSRWLDRVFRKDMYDRFRLTVEECGVPEVQSVLDIGTGSGRFCIPLAQQGRSVVGVDFSRPMLEMARQYAAAAGVGDRCEFREGNFVEMAFDRPFDAVMAIGLFDYIREPVPFLEEIRGLARRKFVATFPTVWTWRVVPRWVRLRLKGCPVYFFTPRRVRELYARAGLDITRFERVGKIYFVVAVPRGASNA